MDIFEGLLTQFSLFSVTDIDSAASNSNNPSLTDVQRGKKVANYITKGTILAQKGIKKGTSIAAKGINKSKIYLKKRIRTREQKHVSAKTLQRIKQARMATSTAVSVSKAIVTGAKVVCGELAISASNAASNTKWGSKVINSKNGKVQAAKEIGKASLVGLLVLVEELEIAAVVLISEIADASADVVQYKYGDEVGNVAHETANVVKNVANIGKNVFELGAGPMLGTFAANAAVDMMSTEEEKKQVRNVNSDAKSSSTVALLASTVLAHNSSNL